MAAPGSSQAARYEVMREYRSAPENLGVGDASKIDVTPYWAIAVIRLGHPVSYSRSKQASLGTAADGAFTRHRKPLVITDDCVALNIQNSKRSHVKSLSATLRHSTTNYLAADGILPGDWVLAWIWNSEDDARRVLNSIRDGRQSNGFSDGLKFVGRAHQIARDVQNSPDGPRSVTYDLVATGFEELDTQFFYDPALASAAFVQNGLSRFIAQIGLDFNQLAEKEQMRSGQLKDNCEKLLQAMINLILGKGADAAVNIPLERARLAMEAAATPGTIPQTTSIQVSPQANKEAPFAYLVPRTVGSLLGLSPEEGTKGGIFGYADILETVLGVQEYNSKLTDSSMFTPKLRATSTMSRKVCVEPLKGTFVPVNSSFVNRPLWQLFSQWVNPVINEMYTALRVNQEGAVVPTLVARQIPFSTEAAEERPELRLTRFLNLPRWVLHPTMLSRVHVARSNATRCNLMHVYGEAMDFAANRSITNQMVRNPPIFDELDAQRSGIRAMMRTVNCALPDQLRHDGVRPWMEAAADWAFGSQYTLSGHAECQGIQLPIAEGDNCEIEDVVYHIESVSHHASITTQGDKVARTFRTVLELSNGMPSDQTEATTDFPHYAGFTNFELSDGVTSTTETTSDPEFGTSMDPGTNSASSPPLAQTEEE